MSVGGYNGTQVLTPAVLGYTIRLTLARDAHYAVYHGNILIDAGQFTIQRERAEPSNDLVDVIHYSGTWWLAADQAISLVAPDTLSIVDAAFDAFRSTYARVAEGFAPQAEHVPQRLAPRERRR